MNSSDITLIIFSIGSVSVSIIISLRCIKRCYSPILSIETRDNDQDQVQRAMEEGSNVLEQRNTKSVSFAKLFRKKFYDKEKIKKHNARPHAILM